MTCLLYTSKAETLLYCALVAYIVFEGPEEERNMNTLVEMINSKMCIRDRMMKPSHRW